MSEGRDYITRAEEKGDIYISQEVLSMIAGAAAMEIEGVSALSGGNLGDQLLGKTNLSRGVSIVREEDDLVVNISISIQYGYPIQELTQKVQESVKASLEATSSLSVRAVNIRVSGISFDKSTKS